MTYFYANLQTSFKALFFVILVTFIGQPAFAASLSIYLAHSGIKESDRSLIDSLIVQLQKTKPPGHTIKQLNIQGRSLAALETLLNQPQSCIITFGDFALEKVLAARLPTPIFSLMVARHKLDNYIENYRQFGVPLSGLYQEQSFARQLMLAKAIKPELTNIGALFGSKTRYALVDHQKIAKQLDLNLTFNLLRHHASAQKYFSRMPIDDGFLIILNDSENYSTTDLQSLMLTSNKRKIPMIGAKPSDSVFAALASVQTPAENLAKEAASIVGDICAGKAIPKANYPKDFEVYINPHIAEFLGYEHLQDAKLLASLKSQEEALNND